MIDRFDDVYPNRDMCSCFGGAFYLIRQSTDANYGAMAATGWPEIPSSGGCP